MTEQGTGQGDEVLASRHLVYLSNMAVCGLVIGYAWGCRADLGLTPDSITSRCWWACYFPLLSASMTSSVKGEKVWYVLGKAHGTRQVRVVVCDVKALCKGLFPVL